jgi:predicted PurR-regulated permease PerM
MFFQLLQLICISLIFIFLGHQVFNYIKSNYMTPSSTTTTVNDFKKMYEKMANTIKSHNDKTKPVSETEEINNDDNANQDNEHMQSELASYLENLSAQ